MNDSQLDRRDVLIGAAALAATAIMDMYEHAYQMDFGAAATKYIDAFFANVKWETVDRRLQAARKARGALTA